MPIPRVIAQVNRFVTNPILRLVAGWAPGFAIIRHRGPAIGQRLRTPVNIFAVEGGFIVITIGWGSGRFCPGVSVIRAQMAAFLHRGTE